VSWRQCLRCGETAGLYVLYDKLTFGACGLDLQQLDFMSASPDALQIYVVASKQGATSREMINAISKTANSTSNTALSLLGGEYTSEATAIEYKRIEFELLEVLWHDPEGPDEKVSRHTVCLFT